MKDRCGNTIHSDYVTDHQCQRERGHGGDCHFGAELREVALDRARISEAANDLLRELVGRELDAQESWAYNRLAAALKGDD